MTMKLSLLLRGENLNTVVLSFKSSAVEKDTKTRKTQKLWRNAMSSLLITAATDSYWLKDNVGKVGKERKRQQNKTYKLSLCPPTRSESVSTRLKYSSSGK
jgi:hypothetical protein